MITVTDSHVQRSGRDLRKEIQRIQEVVSFPSVVAEILGALSDQHATTAKVITLIESDPALTAKILSIANSPFYGLRSNVSTIDHAMRMLGLEEIGHLLLTLQMKLRFSSLDRRHHERFEALWKHSVAVASTSRLFAAHYHLPTDGKEYTAGLLHDMGKLVLIQYFPEEYAKLDSLMTSLSMKDIDAEWQTIAVTHTEIGKQLGEQWRLPKEYLDVMQHHHSPEKAVNAMLTAAVRIADVMCESWGNGIGEPDEGSADDVRGCLALLSGQTPMLHDVQFYDLRAILMEEMNRHQNVFDAFTGS